MGKTNSKPNLSDPFPLQIASIPRPQKMQPIFYLHKAIKSEKKMIIYNWVPKNMIKTKISKSLSNLIKRKGYHIKNLKIDSNSLSPKCSNTLKVLPMLRNLKSVEIEYWGHRNLTKQNFMQLAQGITYFKYLKSFRLKNNDPDNASFKGSVLTLAKLSKLHDVRQVNIAFTNFLHGSDPTQRKIVKAKPIFKSIGKLVKIKFLQINLSTFEYLKDKKIEKLKYFLTKLKSLQELQLDLSYCAGLKASATIPLIEPLKKLEMNCLKLNIGGNEAIITDSEIIEMCNKISALKKLKALGLGFGGTANFTQKGVEELTKNIRLLNNLTKIQIDFSGCQNMKDLEIISFSQGISYFENLNYLDLNFLNSSITDIGIINLAQSITKLIHLEDLLLSFGGHEGTDHALINIGQSLNNMKRLKFLQLVFRKNKVSDTGIKKFSKVIGHLSQLNSLWLDFSVNGQITGKGLASLSENLAYLVNLKELRLEFNHSDLITADGVLVLGYCIKRLQSLRKTTIQFVNCPKVTKEAQPVINFFDNLPK